MVILGLGDGSLLYDNLHADIHPLNVKYESVYNFLNCLEISPCWGWLNSNEVSTNCVLGRLDSRVAFSLHFRTLVCYALGHEFKPR